MRRIFLLAMSAISAVAVTLIPADAQQISADEFLSELVDRKLETKTMGLPARLVFASDNTVSIQAPVGASEGTWSIQGGQICMTITSGPQPGTRCGGFERLGDGRYANGQGQVFTVR